MTVADADIIQSSATQNTIASKNCLPDQKANQKKNLQDEHDKIVNDIKNDNTLTAAEKQKQTADADKALTMAQNNIDQATNADDVNKAFDNGKAAIDDAHKSVSPVKPINTVCSYTKKMDYFYSVRKMKV